LNSNSGALRVGAAERYFCQGQTAHYKIPRQVRFVGEFPMTVTGKIQKLEMRNAMVSEGGEPRRKLYR